ncbi:uncharacterized protein LOC133502451 [Syngnathoides biaculeatus]|uniref:uncharacterized protein LOC133502451 n=1 Tax=Syngnathoides biaculeatus TaxID=300417 RepID=UPI002ADDBA27|nr:uncharacterized protein LOC133502451 [Syngnathoides biaculeatus]
MAALFGLIWVSFLLLACQCLSSQSGFREDASSRYPGVLDPQAFTQDQDSVAPNLGTEDGQHRNLLPQAHNESDESPPQHQDSRFQHPFNLLVQEHMKGTAVEGISFTDIGNLKQFTETLKSSFLIPGQDLSHFQTARGVMLNEIAERRSSKEDNDDDEVWNQPLSSVDGQSENDVGYLVSSPGVSLLDSDNSVSGRFPEMHNRSESRGRSGQSAYQTGPSNIKTGGDWWINNQRPENPQLPANSLREENAPLSPRGTNPLHVRRVASPMAKRSSIKRLKKPPIQSKMAPSQQGSYAESVYVKVPRSPIASRVHMPNGRSKQKLQTAAAKDISSRAQKPTDQSSHSSGVLGQRQLLREPVNFFSPRDRLVRHDRPTLEIRKPRPSPQKLDAQNQQSRGWHQRDPNSISQRLHSVQHRVASRKYPKPNTKASWLHATQPKIPQANGISRLPTPQRPTHTFHRALPVHRVPKWPMSRGKKLGFQSRSSYVRSNVVFSKSQYTPRKRVFTRGQDAQEPWRLERSTLVSRNAREAPNST